MERMMILKPSMDSRILPLVRQHEKDFGALVPVKKGFINTPCVYKISFDNLSNIFLPSRTLFDYHLITRISALEMKFLF